MAPGQQGLWVMGDGLSAVRVQSSVITELEGGKPVRQLPDPQHQMYQYVDMRAPEGISPILYSV
jgi:hypothetical protein